MVRDKLHVMQKIIAEMKKELLQYQFRFKGPGRPDQHHPEFPDQQVHQKQKSQEAQIRNLPRQAPNPEDRHPLQPGQHPAGNLRLLRPQKLEPGSEYDDRHSVFFMSGFYVSKSLNLLIDDISFSPILEQDYTFKSKFEIYSEQSQI